MYYGNNSLWGILVLEPWIEPIYASIASGVPARVPLMPSWASSTLPFSARPAQMARSGSRNSRKSGSAANW